MKTEELPAEVLTFTSLLSLRAKKTPDREAFSFLKNGETITDQITYGDLEKRAKLFSVQLKEKVQDNDRVLLLYQPGIEYIIALFACFYADVIAVPAYPPHLKKLDERLLSIIKNCEPKIALCDEQTYDKLLSIKKINSDFNIPEFIKINPDFSEKESNTLTNQKPESTAFLQYTSGSTADPKAVILTHSNLMHNLSLIKERFNLSEETKGLSWLPPYHDMGLIGFVLGTVYCGSHLTIMAPSAFLQKPLRWLQAIDKYRITSTGGPNFGYEYCIKKITDSEIENLDLSCWKVAYNGAELVSASTINRFSEKFSAIGFKKSSFAPCYGLAESSLLVTNAPLSEDPIIVAFETDQLKTGKAVEENALLNRTILVSSGKLFSDPIVRISDPESKHFLDDGYIGEILISSASVTNGYWNNPATTDLFQDFDSVKYLKTGDLGFIHKGELFVTGRIKDLIIIRGKNHYPLDIELSAEQSHESLQSMATAAFTIEKNGEEKLVLAIEIKRTHLKIDFEVVFQAIKMAILEKHQIAVHAIVLLQPASIPKTTSGKIRRKKCMEDFMDGNLKVVAMKNFDRHISINEKMLQVKPANKFNINSSQVALELKSWLRNYASERINSFIMDERRTIPPYIILDFGNKGLMGMQVEEKYGGLNLSNTDSLSVMEQMGAIDLTLASLLGVHQALGTRPIKNFASQNTKDAILPMIAQGRELAAFALTEPMAGSNPAAMKATAIQTGKDEWKLYGQKDWIGLGSWAGYINVFAQLKDENNKANGITGFVIKQGTKGLRMGPEALTMGVRGMVQNMIYLDGVRVTKDQLLGLPGQGMEVAQDAMKFGRLGLGIMSVGSMKKCAQIALTYVEKRNISTGRLLDNAVTLAKLSDLNAAILALESFLYQITGMLDNGIEVPEEIYMICKTSGPEFLWKAADDLMQLIGGRGYIETNLVPQIFRDARLLRIFEGPTETILMALGSRLLYHNAEFLNFLNSQFNVTEITDQLKELSGNRNISIFEKQWVQYSLGEVVTYATLLASLKSNRKAVNSPFYINTIYWLEEKYNAANTRSKKAVFAENASITKSIINNYTASIGNINQQLPGANYDTDVFLKNDSDTDQVKDNEPEIASFNTEILAEATSDVKDQYKNYVLNNKRKDFSVFEYITGKSNTENIKNRKHIEEEITAYISEVLEISKDSLDLNQPVISFGLDSLTIVEFQVYLEKEYKTSISNEAFYDRITFKELIDQIVAGGEIPYKHVAENASIEKVLKSIEAEPVKDMDFSLMFFSDSAGNERENKYELLLNAAKFADKNGFKAVWLPERHFNSFGGLYPNPSVTASALATITQNIRLRAGSVVLPLHHPIRVAEEWAVVDNLSNGRVDLSFTPGWSANDFVLASHNYDDKLEKTLDGIAIIQKLWKGEKVPFKNGKGEMTEIGIFPLPKNQNQQIWLNCTKEKERFEQAGKMGANVLTALLMQTPEELSINISIYKQSREKAGFDPEKGIVTLMLHAFLGEDEENVKMQVREPLIDYIKSSVKLWKLTEKPLENLSATDQDRIIELALNKYTSNSSLIGTAKSCLHSADKFKKIGVNEIACLIDFGLDDEKILESLKIICSLINKDQSKQTEASVLTENSIEYLIS